MTADVCRVCEDPTANKNIFSPKNKHIQKKLAACADIELSVLDDLPKFICEKCQDTLNIAYDFKVQVEYTDRKFRLAHKTSQQKDIGDIQELKFEEECVYEEEYGPIELLEDPDNVELEESEESSDKEFFAKNSSDRRTSEEEIEYEYVEYELNTSADGMKSESDTYQEEEVLSNSQHEPEHSNDYEYTSERDQNTTEDVEELNAATESMDDLIDISTNDSRDNLLNDENGRAGKLQGKLKDKVFSCDTCKEQFTRYADFNEHKKTHGAQRYQCETCSKWFSKRYKLKNHKKIHETERQYECTQCDRKYTNPGNLERHIRHFHRKERPYMCNECGLSFNRSNILKQHYAVHMNEKTVPCDECGKKFKTEYYLSIHKKCHIPIELRKKRPRDQSKKASHSNSFTCLQCGKISNNVWLHKNHLRTHTGEKPYECKICNKKFSFQQSLRTHMLLHTGEKPYKCSQCDASFRQIGHLKGHMLIHSGVKQHQCKFCHKTFALKGNLTVHERLHTGEMPYKCPICSKRFYDSNGLRRHKATHEDTSQEQIVEDQDIEEIKVYLDENGTELADIIEMQTIDEEKLANDKYVICEFVTS